ncbi:MAG: helix-turn-helix domain-containing protein [Gammaproteobacteria bacterium]|nr:helix-turn-helix domain-containing protein [Gammaproteobacteria bacterium]
MNEPDELNSFPGRLNRALDRVDFPAGRGRVSALAAKLDVRPQAVRTWLHAESMPSDDNLARLARLTGVGYEWLARGTGPMRGTEQVQETAADYGLERAVIDDIVAVWEGLTQTQRNELRDIALAMTLRNMKSRLGNGDPPDT